MNSVPLTIIAILSILTLCLGSASYYFYGAKEEAIASLGVAVSANSSLVKAAQLQTISCRIDDTNIAEVEADKKALQARVDDITNQIANLKSGIKKTADNTGTIKHVETNTPLSGNELLSDDLRQLLDQSYCLVEPDGCSVPTGQSASKPL